jgi:hypothetical protein
MTTCEGLAEHAARTAVEAIPGEVIDRATLGGLASEAARPRGWGLDPGVSMLGLGCRRSGGCGGAAGGMH